MSSPVCGGDRQSLALAVSDHCFLDAKTSLVIVSQLDLRLTIGRELCFSKALRLIQHSCVPRGTGYHNIDMSGWLWLVDFSREGLWLAASTWPFGLVTFTRLGVLAALRENSIFDISVSLLSLFLFVTLMWLVTLSHWYYNVNVSITTSWYNCNSLD